METNQQNKKVSKIEPETWKLKTNWQWPEGKRKEDNGGKKRKGQVKEHVYKGPKDKDNGGMGEEG